jgi:hypothetical protein
MLIELHIPGDPAKDATLELETQNAAPAKKN